MKGRGLEYRHGNPPQARTGATDQAGHPARPHQTADELVEQAVSMLHEQEVWLSQNRVEIAAKIDKGYAAAQRGELIEADAVRSWLAEWEGGKETSRLSPGVSRFS
jgi:predicted transcriptional regulator